MSGTRPPSRQALPLTSFRRARRVVAVAAHASDLLSEAGGTLETLVTAGVPVEVVLATDGGETRRVRDGAFRRLGLARVPVHRLALPGRVPQGAGDDVLAALSEVIGFDPGAGVLVLAPAPLTGRADRAVLSRAARLTAGVYRTALVRYLPAGEPTRPWAVRVRLPSEVAARKRRAVAVPAAAVERFLVDHTVTRPQPLPRRAR